MKVFFTASLRGKKFFKNYYTRIYNQLKALSFDHLDNEVMNLHEESFYADLDKKGPKAYSELYSRKLESIQQADMCVFECSINSLSIGFQIEKSLEFNKPTLLLYKDDHVPQFLAGINEDKLIITSYNDANLEEKLSDNVSLAQNLREKRFNFFISPALLTYLEEASKKQGITKSTFIRNLLLDHRKKNKKAEN